MARPPPCPRPSTTFLVRRACIALSALQKGSAFHLRSHSRSLNVQTTRTLLSQPTCRAPSSRPAAATAADNIGVLSTDSNAFRLVQYREAVELQTAMYKLTPRNAGDVTDNKDLAEVHLVSMVHLADEGYYTEIMREADSFDRVLFELIAGPDVSGLDSDGNRAVTEYVYPTREQVPVL